MTSSRDGNQPDAGELTPIEMHDTVTYNGENATVIKKYFGKFALLLHDGTEVKNVARSEIEKVVSE